MSAAVDKFLANAKLWKEEMIQLRAVLKGTKLEEDFKWRLPCYTHGGANILILQPFKACLGMMFFKGSLLKDPKKALVANGPMSQAGRRFEFRSVREVRKLAPLVRAYVKEAIAIEDSGKKVEFKAKPIAMPAELKKIFAKNAKLRKAFRALTPGRQRAYLYHFSGAKQAATRQSRIEKCVPMILKGRGLLDP